jgi:hypothetical protein
MFTFTIIFVPVTAAVVISIWMSDTTQVSNLTKIVMSIIEVVFLYMSLKNLFTCAFTEPGIIPSVHMHTNIPQATQKLADENRDYVVKYQTRSQLQDTMDHLKIKTPVEKYFNLNKFRYLEKRQN